MTDWCDVCERELPERPRIHLDYYFPEEVEEEDWAFIFCGPGCFMVHVTAMQMMAAQRRRERETAAGRLPTVPKPPRGFSLRRRPPR